MRKKHYLIRKQSCNLLIMHFYIQYFQINENSIVSVVLNTVSEFSSKHGLNSISHGIFHLCILYSSLNIRSSIEKKHFLHFENKKINNLKNLHIILKKK